MRYIRNSLCYLLVTCMVGNPIVLQHRLARGQQPAEAPKNDPAAKPGPEKLQQIADEMKRGFNALEAAAKAMPRDTFDPQAIVDKVGREPVKLFEWVRDNTYWVPYQGALRGPTGVLMEPAGPGGGAGAGWPPDDRRPSPTR